MSSRFTQAQVDAHQARFVSASGKAAGGDAMACEAKLHELIFGECRRRRWIVFHGAMSERTHRTKGEPDFVILADCGRVYLVECKSKTGKLSPEQAGMKFAADMLGHRIHVIRSLGEFLDILK